MEGAESAETPLSGDFYYLKALNYLASATPDSHSDADSLECLHCPSKHEEDHFSLGCRSALSSDHDDLHASGTGATSRSSSHSGGSSPSGEGGAGAGAGAGAEATVPSSTSPARRQRKCSIGGRFYKTALNSGEFPSKADVKRKLSDGHVHWADEFHKDLTRSHPRKGYSRHPSHVSHHVKPILKPIMGELDPDDC